MAKPEDRSRELRAKVLAFFRTRTLGVLVAVSVVTVLTQMLLRVAANNGRINTGLWNWLELIIAPVSLAFFSWYLEHRERRADRVVEEQRVQQAWKREDERDSHQTYESCVEFVHGQLRLQIDDYQPPYLRTAVVRARVLETLFRLENDSRRRDSLLQFLKEARLLTRMDADEEYPALDPLFRETKLAALKLPKADLQHVRFEKASLSDAVLEGADLSHAWLEGIDGARANLRGAKLRSSHCEKATLVEAKLDEVDLTEASLLSANLRGTKMEKVQAEKAQFRNCDLTGAELPGAKLVEANFEGASLQAANLSGADMRLANLCSANLTDANLDYVQLKQASFNEDTELALKWRIVLHIVGSTQAANSGSPSQFSTDEVNAELLALFVSSPGPTLDLRRQDLSRVDLSQANMRGYDFRDANMRDAILEGADLSDATLQDCDLANCSWKGAIVRPEQLQSAKNVAPEWLAAARSASETVTTSS